MSYSRWSTSNWYVFWDSAYSGETIETQHLACWYSIDDASTKSWSYVEVDNLLSKAPDYIINNLSMKYDCSPDEANELQELMQLWRSDVRRQYSA